MQTITTKQNRSTIKFWDRIAEKYSKSPITDEAAYQKKLDITREYFSPDTKVMEFGCGTGSTAILHAPYVQNIEAIDISTNMVEIAKQKAATANISNIHFKQATMDNYEAPDESFDVILGLSILHLLEDKEATLNKIYRLLKPGGIFISSTACLGDKMRFFKLIAPIGKFFGLLPTLRVFSTEELKDSLTQAAFEIDHEWKPEKAMAVFIISKKPKY